MGITVAVDNIDNDLLPFFAVFAFVAFIIGLGKGGFGGTLGGLGTPLMALVMPADQVIGLLLPILMFADLFAIGTHWKRWHWRLVLLLIPGSLAGVFVGTLFITNVSTEALQRGLGFMVLLFVCFKLFEQRMLDTLHYTPRSWHGLMAGVGSGFSSTLAHIGGPPIAIYLLMQDVTPRMFAATSALFFFALNWIKVPFYIYANLFDINRLRQVAWLLPLMPIGIWVGARMVDKVNNRTFERIVVILLTASAILLLVR